MTALTHFSQSHFTRVTTRVALESALVYHPATGEVETVVKGGAKNHTAMLELFGKHVVQQDLAPSGSSRSATTSTLCVTACSPTRTGRPTAWKWSVCAAHA